MREEVESREQQNVDHSPAHGGGSPRTEDQAKPHHPGIVRPPELPPAPPRTALLIVAAFLLVLIGAAAITLLLRAHQSRTLAKETERAAIPIVAVVKPVSEKADLELVLPGSLQAYKESPIYARTSGYLRRWTKDIGSPIKAGELLADIEAPEVDQELSQARATRQQILAQMELAKISAERWQNLRQTDSVSAQEADQQSSGYRQAQANLAAADANVRRLEQLESFKNVYAPFSGVLTRRNIDPGALINAGAGGREMFDIAQVDPLRVYVSVPQAYATNIKTGAKAFVTMQEFPGKRFEGTITRTAEAIDPATRTLLTEVQVPNANGTLLPGSYGQVHFAMSSGVQKVTVPVNAMLFRTEGPRVAVVRADGTVELRPISIGRDFGSSLEILGGVSEGEQVIVNPADSLENGQKVRIAPQQSQQKGGAS